MHRCDHHSYIYIYCYYYYSINRIVGNVKTMKTKYRRTKKEKRLINIIYFSYEFIKSLSLRGFSPYVNALTVIIIITIRTNTFKDVINGYIIKPRDLLSISDYVHITFYDTALIKTTIYVVCNNM